MPCNPSNLNLNLPNGPGVNAIPGFGIPFSLKAPAFDIPMPDNFPEDLNGVFNALQFILPSGVIKPALNPNFGKDLADGILKLMDHFFPVLMLYKMFLPMLNLIICIIEVLCSIANPFKLASKLQNLFRSCLPAFLSLFPIFAIIVMLLSLLFLLITLIEYIIAQVLLLVEKLLININGLIQAFQFSDDTGILAIVRKLAQIICSFQNLFVLLSLFKTILDVIKEVLKLFFSIPPCDDADNGNANKCCDSTVCPQFLRNNETIISTTGTLQYYNLVAHDANLTSLLPTLPSGFLTQVKRPESWQFFDGLASQANAFYNITQAYDLPPGNTTVFFPTDANYTATTPINQVPYTLDMRLFYIPINWNNLTDMLGPRFIRINGCIILQAPKNTIDTFDNSTAQELTGVLQIQGGLSFEDDGKTPLLINGTQGTLNTTIHTSDVISITDPQLLSTDGSRLLNIDYTLHINHGVLLGKSLITLGCIPSVALDRTFVNTVFGANSGINFTLLNSLVNGDTFPNIDNALQCLSSALDGLRSNISPDGVATFQTTTNVCLAQLQSDTTSTINSLLGIGFDQFHSTFTLTPNVQFTTQTIDVKVSLNETNGQSLTLGMPASLGDSIAKRINPRITFGDITNFVYDGHQFFNASISSTSAGNGTISMTFDGKPFSLVTLPTDLTKSPSITEIILPYTFVFSASRDIDGKPRFNESDIADGVSTNATN